MAPPGSVPQTSRLQRRGWPRSATPTMSSHRRESLLDLVQACLCFRDMSSQRFQLVEREERRNFFTYPAGNRCRRAARTPLAENNHLEITHGAVASFEARELGYRFIHPSDRLHGLQQQIDFFIIDVGSVFARRLILRWEKP